MPRNPSLPLALAVALGGCATGPIVSFAVHSPDDAKSLIHPGMTIEVVRASDPRRRRMQVVAEDATAFVSRNGVRVDFADVREVTILPRRMSASEIAAAALLVPLMAPCALARDDCFK